jgi:hypothetical protein
MATARARFDAHVDASPTGSTIPLALSWEIEGAAIEIDQLTLASGDNTLAVPTNTVLVIVVPPTSNPNTLKWKGAAGDTGVLVRPSIPLVHTWASGPLLLNASASTAVTIAYVTGTV